MCFTEAVQVKGFGSVLRRSMYAVIAAISSSTLVTAKRFSWRWLSSAKNRSTRFNHEELVGTKWK